MKRRQLKSLRIAFVVLSFLLYLNARAAAFRLAGAELKQQTQPQPLVARSAHQQQPQVGRQHDNARRSQPFNALLTSVGQLGDSPLRHGGHLALTASHASGRKRLARAASDDEPQARMHFGGGSADGETEVAGIDFGDMFTALFQFILNGIDAILKFFAPTPSDGESKK